MKKLVLLHKRVPGVPLGQFHSALARAASDDPPIADLARYVQSHTLERGYAKGELLIDAVEELTFAGAPAAEAFVASPQWQEMLARRAPLVDPGTSHRMLVDVHRVKDRPVPAGAVKNIEFVNRRPGMALAPFRKYWREFHGPLASRIPSILRYEQNHLAMSEYENAPEPRFDGLAVTWFESTAAMRAGAETEAYAETRADEPNFLPDGHLPIIITREVLER